MLKKCAINERSSDATYRDKTYWALGKRFDPELIAFFRKRLSIELQRDMEAVYQIMVALDNLDEPVFSEHRDSHVITEHQKNRSDAESYLKKTDQHH